MADLAQHPDEVLLRFVNRLPTTIQDVVLARCCMAFGRLQPVPKQDLFATFRAILLAHPGQMRTYTCVQMAAVLELILDTPEATLPDEWQETPTSQRLLNIDLQAPLTQKHWLAARDDFSALKNGTLHGKVFRHALMNAADGQRASTKF